MSGIPYWQRHRWNRRHSQMPVDDFIGANVSLEGRSLETNYRTPNPGHELRTAYDIWSTSPLLQDYNCERGLEDPAMCMYVPWTTAHEWRYKARMLGVNFRWLRIPSNSSRQWVQQTQGENFETYRETEVKEGKRGGFEIHWGDTEKTCVSEDCLSIRSLFYTAKTTLILERGQSRNRENSVIWTHRVSEAVNGSTRRCAGFVPYGAQRSWDSQTSIGGPRIAGPELRH